MVSVCTWVSEDDDGAVGPGVCPTGVPRREVVGRRGPFVPSPPPFIPSLLPVVGAQEWSGAGHTHLSFARRVSTYGGVE